MIEWDEAALRRLKRAPFFVRGMAKRRVEQAAREEGVGRITVEFMERIKRREMGR